MKLAEQRTKLDINSNLKIILSNIEYKIKSLLQKINDVNLSQKERLFHLDDYNEYLKFVEPIKDIIIKVRYLKFNNLIEFETFINSQNYPRNFISYVINYVTDDYNETLIDNINELRD